MLKVNIKEDKINFNWYELINIEKLNYLSV